MKNKFILILLISMSVLSCKRNRWDINVKNQNVNLEVKRFDRDLFNLNVDSIWQFVPVLKEKYGVFFDLYNTQIINIGSSNMLDYNEKLSYFLTDPDIYGSYSEAQKTINIDNIKNELEDAFKHYAYYFPNKIIPQIFTHISGFNQSIVIDSGYISIALDKYLGKNNKYYQMLRTPRYKRANMHPAKISSDVMLAWAETEFLYKSEHNDLISQMLYFGKLHIFLDAMLPNTPDTLKWGYSKHQMEWNEHNEQRMWLYLVEHKQIFNTQYKTIQNYIQDSPFTNNFSKQSSPRTGRWIGYQIVRSYLKNNPQVTLPDLMMDNDYRNILNQSKYKP